MFALSCKCCLHRAFYVIVCGDMYSLSYVCNRSEPISSASISLLPSPRISRHTHTHTHTHRCRTPLRPQTPARCSCRRPPSAGLVVIIGHARTNHAKAHQAQFHNNNMQTKKQQTKSCLVERKRHAPAQEANADARMSALFVPVVHVVVSCQREPGAQRQTRRSKDVAKHRRGKFGVRAGKSYVEEVRP